MSFIVGIAAPIAAWLFRFCNVAMRESTLLSMRAVVDRQGHALQEVVLPGLRDVTLNERITRTRTDKVEARLDAFEHWQGFSTVWQRLRWLLTGYVPDVAQAASQSVYPTAVAPTEAHGLDPVEAECGCPPLVN